MNRYNPAIHHRRSIRLQGYDYSQAGWYCITICTQDRLCLFGEIVDGKMVLNDAGRMVDKWFRELENKFHDIRCHEYIIMPNHMHFIIENIGTLGMTVGADLCVCPPDNNDGEHVVGNHAGLHQPREMDERIRGEHVGSPLRNIVQWFKTMTTNEYIRNVKQNGWPPFPGKLWQRNYYEHIIRNEIDYQIRAEYILNNPSKWQKDGYDV